MGAISLSFAAAGKDEGYDDSYDDDRAQSVKTTGGRALPEGVQPGTILFEICSG